MYTFQDKQGSLGFDVSAITSVQKKKSADGTGTIRYGMDVTIGSKVIGSWYGSKQLRDNAFNNIAELAFSETNLFINLRGVTGAFQGGEVVTGGTSGATATVSAALPAGDTVLLAYTGLTGTFEYDEVVTGGTSGATGELECFCPFVTVLGT